jgi:predicted SAM-dependent methyltransferase
MIFLDATVDFPFGRAVFDYVYSEHLIEHLPYNDGKFMLRECHRVLRPGGKIRIATPDLRKLVGLLFDEAGRGPEYVRWITEKFLPHVRTRAPSIVVNNAFYNWGHRFLYDFATLKAMLEEAGFADVAMFGSGESNDDNLRGLERHGEMVGNPEMARFETMVLQARRPAD